MGCDIHTKIEVYENGVWTTFDKDIFPFHDQYVSRSEPFDWRSYRLFGVLAGVRNYSGITPIKEPCGWPEDSPNECDGHTPTWYLLSELLDFDWNKPCEDRRVSRQIAPNMFSGGETCEPGEGEMKTYRQMVGSTFMDQLHIMKCVFLDPTKMRIVMFFDN